VNHWAERWSSERHSRSDRRAKLRLWLRSSTRKQGSPPGPQAPEGRECESRKSATNADMAKFEPTTKSNPGPTANDDQQSPSTIQTPSAGVLRGDFSNWDATEIILASSKTGRRRTTQTKCQERNRALNPAAGTRHPPRCVAGKKGIFETRNRLLFWQSGKFGSRLTFEKVPSK